MRLKNNLRVKLTRSSQDQNRSIIDQIKAAPSEWIIHRLAFRAMAHILSFLLFL